MKIALTRMAPIWEEKEANYREAERLIRLGAEAGAQMVIFPEMSFTGFSMNVSKTGEDTTGFLDGHELTPSCERMLLLSRKYPVSIVFGYVRRTEAGRYYNSLMAVAEGHVLAQYDKLHPFTYGDEGTYFTGGTHLAKCELGGIRMGFLICYDLRFPEIFQALSEDCTCIAVIANWPAARIAHWRTLLRARAIENQCYILGVNRTGKGGGLSYDPPSTAAYDPYGRRLGAKEAGEGRLLLTEVDVARAEAYRREFPLKQDRRKEFYKNL